MTDNNQLLTDIGKLYATLELAQADDVSLTITIVDLLISTCHYVLMRLASLQPKTSGVGILLLNIELQAVKFLEGKDAQDLYEIIRKDIQR